jgi:CII-binding regulator of phage lambda lysogenization HflD
MQENKLIAQVLGNLKSIKALEEENKKLQGLILKSKDSDVFKKKAEDLLYLLEEKDKKFQALQEKLAFEYKNALLFLKEKLEKEKEGNARLAERILQLEAAAKEHASQRMYYTKLKFLMKKEYEKKIEEMGANFHVYKEKHKSIIKDYENSKLDSKKMLELSKGKIHEQHEAIQRLLEKIQYLESENDRLNESNKRLATDMIDLNSRSIANVNELKVVKARLEEDAKKKLNEAMKDFLEREIGYKAIIDSKNQDLRKHIEDLNSFKERYYRREKQLKEKISELF